MVQVYHRHVKDRMGWLLYSRGKKEAFLLTFPDHRLPGKLCRPVLLKMLILHVCASIEAFVCRRLPANEKNTHLRALRASAVRSNCRQGFNIRNRFVLDNKPIRFHNGFKMKPMGGAYMATVTVKNIPDVLYDRLKSVAETNRRSINSEIIICIENTVLSRRINLGEAVENARQLRQLTAGHPINDEEFNKAKIEGRL